MSHITLDFPPAGAGRAAGVPFPPRSAAPSLSSSGWWTTGWREAHDHDREYRAERISRAVATLAAAVETERRALRGRYSDAELAALWPDILSGLAARLAASLPRPATTLARQGE